MSLAPVQCFAQTSAFKPFAGSFSIPTSTPTSSAGGIFPGMPEIPLQVLLEHAMAIQGSNSLTHLAGLNGLTLPQTPQINVIPESASAALTTLPNLPGTVINGQTQLTPNQLRLNSITKRRNRTTFTHEQAAALEKHYQSDQYMPRSRRALVAESLNLSECQVKTWFQNRRAKDKRNDKMLVEQTSPRPSSSLSPRNPTSESSLGMSLSPKAVTAPVSPLLSLPTQTLPVMPSLVPSPNHLSPLMAASPMFQLTPALAQLYLQAMSLNTLNTIVSSASS